MPTKSASAQRSRPKPRRKRKPSPARPPAERRTATNDMAARIEKHLRRILEEKHTSGGDGPPRPTTAFQDDLRSVAARRSPAKAPYESALDALARVLPRTDRGCVEVLARLAALADAAQPRSAWPVFWRVLERVPAAPAEGARLGFDLAGARAAREGFTEPGKRFPRAAALELMSPPDDPLAGEFLRAMAIAQRGVVEQRVRQRWQRALAERDACVTDGQRDRAIVELAVRYGLPPWLGPWRELLEEVFGEGAHVFGPPPAAEARCDYEHLVDLYAVIEQVEAPPGYPADGVEPEGRFYVSPGLYGWKGLLMRPRGKRGYKPVTLPSSAGGDDNDHRRAKLVADDDEEPNELLRIVGSGLWSLAVDAQALADVLRLWPKKVRSAKGVSAGEWRVYRVPRPLTEADFRPGAIANAAERWTISGARARLEGGEWAGDSAVFVLWYEHSDERRAPRKRGPRVRPSASGPTDDAGNESTGHGAPLVAPPDDRVARRHFLEAIKEPVNRAFERRKLGLVGIEDRP